MAPTQLQHRSSSVLARRHQKLLSTNLRLSHLPLFSQKEQMQHVQNATKHGSKGLGHALIAQDDARTAEVAFYAACVKAREVCIMLEIKKDQKKDESMQDRLQEALEGIAIALSELESCDDVDTAPFEKLAKKYTKPLLKDL